METFIPTADMHKGNRTILRAFINVKVEVPLLTSFRGFCVL